MGCTSLLLSFITVFSYTHPYDIKFVNRLELQALATDILTLLCGMGLFSNSTNDKDRQSPAFAMIVSVFTVVLNTGFMVHLVRVWYGQSAYIRSIREWARRRSRKSIEMPEQWTVNASEIPRGWGRHYSEEHGSYYYVNEDTGEAVWSNSLNIQI